MKNHNSRPSLLHTGIKTSLLTALLVAALIGCGKSPGGPPSPQSPPRPKTQSFYSPSDVEHAVFTSRSRAPLLHYQNGMGVEILPLVIRT